eukprot:gene10303-59293_t
MVDVKFVDKHSQLITLSEDKIIKVWDIRMFRCIQTLTDKERRYPEDKFSGLGYNMHNDAILCGAGVPVVFRDVDVQARFETGSNWHADYEGHLFPVVACIYNVRLGHLLSADDKFIHVWDVKTGRRLAKWSPFGHGGANAQSMHRRGDPTPQTSKIIDGLQRGKPCPQCGAVPQRPECHFSRRCTGTGREEDTDGPRRNETRRITAM